MVNDSRLIRKGIAVRVINVDGRIWATELPTDLSLQNFKVQYFRFYIHLFLLLCFYYILIFRFKQFDRSILMSVFLGLVL